MTTEGPLLESLTRRLAETPQDFIQEPRIGTRGSVNVAAVVNDALVALGHNALDAKNAQAFQSSDAKLDRNRLQIVLLACWLLHDEWFLQHAPAAGNAMDFLDRDLRVLSSVTVAPKFVSDADRREELVRVCLNALTLRPRGETESQAQDRLVTLNAAERERVVHAARASQERAEKIRREMAKKKAQEGADKWNRE